MTDEQESIAKLAMSATKHERQIASILAGGVWTSIASAELDDELPDVLICTQPEGDLVSFVISSIVAVKEISPIEA